LRKIGDRYHNTSIANVATRWVLDHSFVGAVLIGAHTPPNTIFSFFRFLTGLILVLGVRLGISEHLDDNRKVYELMLTEQDNADIEEILQLSNSESMIETIGDCGAEYRNGKVINGATFEG
jgi:hypothetical protein